MKISPEVKQMMFDVVTYMDGYNIDGSRTAITNIPGNFTPTRNGLILKLSKVAQVGFVKSELLKPGESCVVEDDAIRWHTIADVQAKTAFASEEEMKQYTLVKQRFTEDEMDFTTDELKVAKYFYGKRNDFSLFSPEALKELIGLFGV